MILKEAVEKRRVALINRLFNSGYIRNRNLLFELSLADLERLHIEMLCRQAPDK